MRGTGSFSAADVTLVELCQDHPGFNDPQYRARRSDMLAHPQWAELNYAFGEACLRARPDEAPGLIRVYWYTIEFGFIEQDDELKVYGAGILSSFGELPRLGQARLQRWDLEQMAQTAFDPTSYQSQLFVAPSFETMRRNLHGWLDRVGRRAST